MAHRGTDADWLLTGGVVWTGAGGPPGAGARDHGVALRKGRVLAVGPSRELEGLRGPGTRVVELEGRFVAPGFVDAHVHLLVGGLALSRVDLRGVRSPEEFLGRVAARARELPPGSWILGGDWDEREWGGELPSRRWLDRAAPEHPVFLLRSDLHSAVAGSRALDMAGLHRTAPDPENGIVERDPDTREPTGILREMALVPVARLVPEPTEKERRHALRAAFRVALAAGITQVHDMGGVLSPDQSWISLARLRDLQAGGELPLRVFSALPLAHHERIATLVGEEGRGDHFLGWGMAKGFVDGSLGSATAWFREPYMGNPDNVGTPITDLDDLRDCLRGALEAGLRPAVHAIGDRAVDWIIDAWNELGTPAAPRPFRVEHAQHLTPEALPRTALPGMILSVQPYHLVGDAPVVDERLGPDRASRAFAFRSMQEAGARLAFGSDWPVVPMDPLRALHAAVARVPGPGGSGHPVPEPWQPGERLTVEAALRAQTEGAAAAGLWDRETGILEAGRRGDLVVLSEDPFRLEPEGWAKVLKVEMTFVDGVPAFGAEVQPAGRES
jgi:predicted amidohydrolase YtcJ